MRLLFWLAAQSLRPDDAPPIMRAPAPHVPPRAPAPPRVHRAPVIAPPRRVAPPTASTWPAQYGIATYADTRPDAVVWFPEWPAPQRIVVKPGGDT